MVHCAGRGGYFVFRQNSKSQQSTTVLFIHEGYVYVCSGGDDTIYISYSSGVSSYGGGIVYLLLVRRDSIKCTYCIEIQQ